MKNLIALIFLITVFTRTADAQKFGYLNSAEVLSKVPEIAIADSLLKLYQDSLVGSGKVLVDAFQKHVTDYQAETQKGNLAPITAQKKEDELRKEQESLKTFEDIIKQKLVSRRDQLYQPILSHIDGIVKKIGKDNKYTMIFDSSQPGYLFLAESENLGPVIMKELGLEK
ncbi:MAG: OmpH family outer membrane protein [Saprospiraceae bacterium]